jgi:transposase
VAARKALTDPARGRPKWSLIESGVSQRKAAKLLGVSEGTVRNDMRDNSAENAEKLRSQYRSGRSPHWIKSKNPNARAVKQEAGSRGG